MATFVRRLRDFGAVDRSFWAHWRKYRSEIPKLSPHDVNLILRANEFTKELSGGPVRYFDSNQLASNSPLEDARTEASCLYTSGLLVGVFDGHGGSACAQVSSKRILRYIAASLIAPTELQKHMARDAKSYSFLQCHNDRLEFVPEIRDIYEESFSRFAQDLIATNARTSVEDVMERAVMRLDEDMSREAIEHTSVRTVAVAMSGSVACVAHVDGCHLHVAGTGDCGAVLGSVNDTTGQWTARKLTNEHNAQNVGEVRRILAEHPASERDTVIRVDRLLGQLAPLRALGDFRYKWPRDTLQSVAAPHYGSGAVPPHYHTPPYLTAQPEIKYHRLEPRDKFLVLATDGLWDVLTPLQVVRLVGEHMNGKTFLQPLELPGRDIRLGELSQMLAHRRTGIPKKPTDKNSATHLIRNALGGTDYGIEHSKISHILSLPPDVVRLFRDDITVTVVYFDPEYLQSTLV
ncbi:pyruvate dehydrogenase [acetyl-transferring]-phosphatase 1, mitochondrial [Phlebotomus argentipes]|uniref:pyruvate dehydrogenase [acetyl-transferring]-phosphatase 1, mitochondrial n=1 Tax=Phlebotomus argentipes TaxID=94469 RepID=UPI002892D326|nr:pyruvate dehydrogenase [acetyl-transferring]-phosphatase 1, mitochondrial [Phlebotomus argentipes]